jgi:hypothetical protein
MAWALYEFATERGDSLLLEWIRHEKLSKRDLGQLALKLDMLALVGPGLPPKLLAGPIHKHIYKLIIHGDRMLRPFLCKGPFDMDREFTLLLGAIEANGKLGHKPEEAESLRKILLGNPTRRRKHERYR